ncbi:MAG: sulfite exporter TauE/SafE family protein [Hyphomicrobiaceae bacterium]
MEPGIVIALATAAFAGAFVQAATGFGFALIAAPAFLWLMSSTTALQVLVAIHVVQSVMLAPRLFAFAPRRLLIWLVLGSLIGLPLGLWLFLSLDLRALKLALGVTMLAFAALLVAREHGLLDRLARPKDVEVVPRWIVAVAGAAAGFLTAVLIMPGPPVILLAAWLGLPKLESRALSLTFFTVCYVIVTAMHASSGTMTAATWYLVFVLSPAVAVGTLAGNRLAAGLSERRFRYAILAITGLSGVAALLSVL